MRTAVVRCEVNRLARTDSEIRLCEGIERALRAGPSRHAHCPVCRIHGMVDAYGGVTVARVPFAFGPDVLTTR